MSEELETIREGSKAVQEASRTGKAVVDATSDLGKWTANVLGTVPEDIVGLGFGDYLHELRIRNMDRIRRKTEEILKARGVEEPEPIGPKLAIPAFEAASEETDETLQDLWAQLLANARDPNQNIHLLRIMIDTLKAFEPIDALVFRKIAEKMKADRVGLEELRQDTGLRHSLVSVSVDHLSALKCIELSGGGRYRQTSIGEELWLAIKNDGEE